MQARKTAGVVLAVGACALGFWFASSTPHVARSAQDVSVVAPEVVATRAAIPTLALGAVPAANTRGIPFALTRNVAEAAVRAGRLHIATADGRGFDIAIERNTHDAFGNWHVIGRVQTRIGPQAMVATFGRRSVFAVLPTPDGRTLQVITDHGATTIAEAGGLIPDGMQGFGANDDAYEPNELPPATQQPIASTDARANLHLPPARTAALGAFAAQAEGEVAIDVLGVYGPELIALRGDEQTVRDELAHMLEVANQAHVDSGSRIRLVLAGTFLETRHWEYNGSALTGIADQRGSEPGWPLEIARWEAGADLVFMARIRNEDGDLCGASYRGAESTGRNTFHRGKGFAVADVAPCSPYALSHEIGHLLGNAHDPDTEAFENSGVPMHGVFPYAGGYRSYGTPAFATLMADPDGLPQLNLFSSPFSTACGAPCGVADVADEVLSMNAIADDVAQFAGPTGTLTFKDAAGYETAFGEQNKGIGTFLEFNGVRMPWHVYKIEVVGGTATPGVDFQLATPEVMPGDYNAAQVIISVLPDDEVEPDETVLLRVVDSAGVPVSKDTATITILNDDPRAIVRGSIVFDGVPGLPYGDFYVGVRGGNGNRYGDSANNYPVSGPDFRFAIPVVRGTSPRLEAQLPNSFARVATPEYIANVRGDRVRNITYRPARHVIVRGTTSGAVQAIDVGYGAPTSRTGVMVMPPGAPPYIDAAMADGARFSLYDTEQDGTIAAVFDDVRENIDVTLTRTMTPKVLVSAPKAVREGDNGKRRVRFDLRAIFPNLVTPEDLEVQWRTIPGTATAGEDFVAASGTLVIGASNTINSLWIDVLGDKLPESPEWLQLEVVAVTPGLEVVPARTKLTLRDDDHRASMPGGAEQR